MARILVVEDEDNIGEVIETAEKKIFEISLVV